MNQLTPPPLPFHPLWPPDLLSGVSGEVSWLWEGYLASGAVTLLTSRWKAGKTTLLSVLLARMGQGGELAGRAVRPGKALILTEESRQLWARRVQALGLGEQVCWLCRPFPGKPTPEQWRSLLDTVLDLHHKVGLSLFVIDPLALFLPVAENDAGGLVRALVPLSDLTAEGLAVLLLHHPRKGPSAAGSAARGSGALAGLADVLIEMTHCERAGPKDRRRRLRAWSRYPDTPAALTLELRPEGTDYRMVHEDEGRAEPMAEGLRMVLEGATGKLTRQEILDGWLPDFLPRPDGRTLSRWLAQASSSGQVCREGTGHRGDAFRYWLPGREEVWEKDPWYKLNEEMEAARRQVFAQLPPHLRFDDGPDDVD
jgi:hypothetical protein